MATTTATVTINSTDLLTDELSLSSTATLTLAGNSTGLTSASGLSRTNFTNDPVKSKKIYRSDDALSGGANKVYLKNLSVNAAQYFTVYIDQEEMGRLYAGDWAFFPWSATAGTKETFIVTLTLGSGAVEIGDSWEFDGIKTTSTTAVLNTFASEINAQHYPNWTTAVSGAAISFTAREAREDGVITGNTAITGDVLVDLNGSNLTAPITAGDTNPSTRSESDIIVVPSVVTTMDLEHMLLKQ
jgi:hypothetical protein